MKRSLPLAAAIASAAALTVPALADATTYCVAKPDCVTAGGTDEPTFGAALTTASAISPGPDRIELGPGDFTAGSGGFVYGNGAPSQTVEIVGSGQGVTRLLNSSTKSAERTLQVTGPAGNSVSDLTVVAPTPSGVQPIDWALITSATVRRVTVEGAHDYIAVQLNQGGRIEDSTIHGDATNFAVNATESVSISGSKIVSDGGSLTAGSGGTVEVSRTRIDAHAGPVLSGNTTLDISDSLVTTHGGPGLHTSFGVNTTLHATGDTIIGDGVGSAGLMAGEGAAGHGTHVTLANSVISGYGHAIVANQAGGGVDVKLRHSDYDAPVFASAGQVDETEANIHETGGFVDPASGDFHLSAGSPLVDAGDPGVASQADFDGSQRSLDGNGDGTAAPDIGAFEVPAKPIPVVDPPATPGGTDPGTGPGGSTTPGGSDSGPTSKDAPPKLGRLTIGRRHLTIGRRTAFRFKLSERGHVTIAIRRVTRLHATRSAGAIKRSAHKGRNRVAFRGRVGHRALKPGRYVAIAQATDSAGQRSAKRKVHFTLRAPRPRAR
jgi:hypothetical protein